MELARTLCPLRLLQRARVCCGPDYSFRLAAKERTLLEHHDVATFSPSTVSAPFASLKHMRSIPFLSKCRRHVSRMTACCTLKLMLPGDALGRLIGHQGWTKNAIEEKHQTCIETAPRREVYLGMINDRAVMVSALSTATFSSMLLDILNEARLNSFDGIRLALPDACMAKLLPDEDAHRGVDSTVPIQLCHLDGSRVTAALGGRLRVCQGAFYCVLGGP
jgi:hypothetical protein